MSADDCLAGGGQMGAVMRSIDWSKTAAGPVESWSPTLRVMLRTLLVNGQPMVLWWGPSFVQFYNDAFRPALGAKHPRAMGQPASECWAQIWPTLGPLIKTPFGGGESTATADLPLAITRHELVPAEETHWTFACSRVPDDTAPRGIGGVLATVNQITAKVVGERFPAVANARASEQMETILDSITDQFFAFDSAWRYTYLNRHAAGQIRSLGLDPESLIGQTLWETFTEVPNQQSFRRAMTERVLVVDEHFYPPLDEWVENHIYPGADGGIVVFQRYITGRKRTESALRASEERFRRYFELGLIGMAITSPDKGCVEVNDELCRILGYEREELLRISWADITHPDDLAADLATFDRVIAGEIDRYSMDKRWIRKDGRIVHSIMAAECVRRSDGTVDYFVALVQDITERKRSEENLRRSEASLAEARDELARIMRITTMGELAASIAHEVNQPLTAVITSAHACARWLAGEPPNLPEATSAVVRIARDANRAAEVIARIRTFFRRGTTQAVVDLNEVISEVIAMVKEEIRSQSVSLVIAPRADLPPMMGDRVGLQQVVLNLVMNALEAMGAVAEGARILTIEVGWHGRHALRVAVRDSGTGVTDDDRDRIFDAFHTTKPLGIGMGLTISRSIVEAHGGRLWASPNDGPGTTFQFTLPV
jgi:PAS domain S-box-containing protein